MLKDGIEFTTDFLPLLLSVLFIYVIEQQLSETLFDNVKMHLADWMISEDVTQAVNAVCSQHCSVSFLCCASLV